MEKKHLNEIIIFDKFLLEDCKNDGKFKLANNSGVVDIDCVCYRHGPLYALKKKVRKEAIELVKLHLRENKQKAYEVEDKDLEKIIKKKESRVRLKYWKIFIKYVPLKFILAATGLSFLDD